MTEYYKDKFEAGLEYQDYVSDELRKAGIFLGAYSSRKYQQERGESASGIEIKHDMRLAETGNLYFEIAEKSSPDIPDWTKSGILREDSTWLYLIGDYEQAFLFSKEQLKRIYYAKSSWKARGIVARMTQTSIGFTIPVKSVQENGTCIKHFQFKRQQSMHTERLAAGTV